MKVLVVYDSAYGNTEEIARAIGAAVTPPDSARVVKVDAAGMVDLNGVDMLIVGSPTQGGRATQNMQTFISGIPAAMLKDVKVAAFDTRIVPKGAVGRFFIRTFGYAAGRIGSVLAGKSGTQVVEPEGFIVEGKEGPLKEGEVERAAAWAKTLLGKART